MSTQLEMLEQFTSMHDGYIQDWNQAMQTGDTSAMDRMIEQYYVSFYNNPLDKPLTFNKQDALDGMQQSVTHFLGAEKRFSNRVIRLRNPENAVVFFEQLIIKHEQVLARLFTIENWVLIDHKWYIARETEEAI